MRLSSARDLKAALQERLTSGQRAVVYDAGVGRGGGDRLVSSLAVLHDGLTVARAARPLRLASHLPALGIARTDKGWGLAVRIQEPTGMSRQLVDYLTDEAAGEADVRVIGRATAHSDEKLRYRPLRRGISIGHPDVEAGTLGCFVRRPGHPVEVLSANHVLANANQARTGDPIVQPGIFDHGHFPADRVGVLSKVVPLVPGQPNRVDAALCQLDDDLPYDLQVGGRLAGPPNDLTEISDVIKIGRTSGRTEGRITVLELDSIVIDEPHLGSVEFDAMIEVEGTGGPFSEPGDSGAVMTDRAGTTAVGLVVGGNSDLGLSWATPMVDILATLEATLCT